MSYCVQKKKKNSKGSRVMASFVDCPKASSQTAYGRFTNGPRTDVHYMALFENRPSSTVDFSKGPTISDVLKYNSHAFVLMPQRCHVNK